MEEEIHVGLVMVWDDTNYKKNFSKDDRSTRSKNT